MCKNVTIFLLALLATALTCGAQAPDKGDSTRGDFHASMGGAAMVKTTSGLASARAFNTGARIATSPRAESRMTSRCFNLQFYYIVMG